MHTDGTPQNVLIREGGSSSDRQKDVVCFGMCIFLWCFFYCLYYAEVKC